MPILPEKDNPPSKLFECSILEKEGTWWVAKVKPRQEKAFAFDLLEQGIDYYLPFYEKKTKRSDGKFRKSLLVLFPSYVPFISEKPFDHLNQNRVATILPVKLQERFKKELHYVSLSISSGVQIEPISTSGKFKSGDQVKIVGGPMCGAEGVVLDSFRNKISISLSIEYLGCAKITVDDIYIKSNT